MSIKNYRKEIERSVAKAKAGPSRSSRDAKPDPEQLRSVIADKRATAKTRAEALGRLLQAEGPDVVPEVAIRCLADPKESQTVRLAALELLRHQQIFSSVAADWKPRFIDALRAALDVPKLRKAALEILSLHKDRKTQELLLEGIRRPEKAIVSVPHALILLSSDIHADVLEVARSLATDKQSQEDSAVFHQAIRILGSDPASVGRLEEVLADEEHALDARKLAATALSQLSPESLEQPETARRATASARPKRKGALDKHIETLRRIRE